MRQSRVDQLRQRIPLANTTLGPGYSILVGIELTAEDADPVLRAAAAVRLKLRGSVLKNLSNAALAEEKVDLAALSEGERRGFAAYVFLATLQEIVIKHLGEA